MSERKLRIEESVWRAYGPEKDAWKKAGNYYSAEQLDAMEREFLDLTIQPVPKKVYAAD